MQLLIRLECYVLDTKLTRATLSLSGTVQAVLFVKAKNDIGISILRQVYIHTNASSICSISMKTTYTIVILVSPPNPSPLSTHKTFTHVVASYKVIY